MSHPKITVHIGTYKTATSSLQYALARSGDVLAEAGVKFASSGLNVTLSKHLHLFDHIVDAPYNHTRHERHRAEDYLSGLVEEIRDPAVDHLLISEEELSVPDPEIARFFTPLADEAEVQVVMVVRPQAELLESLYLQFLKEPKRQVTATFEEFIDDRENQSRARFDRILDPWSDAFGQDAITVMDFRDLAAEGAITGFARRLGIPTDLVEPPHHLNRSITPAAGELIRRVAGHRPDFPRMLMARGLQHLEQDRKTTLVTKATAKTIERRFRADNKRLASRYGVNLNAGSRQRRRRLERPDLEREALDLGAALFGALWERNQGVRGGLDAIAAGTDDEALTEALGELKSKLPW